MASDINHMDAHRADAIELSIFKHLFAAVAEEMGVRLMRSAYSPNIKERRDFSCALFDSSGEMIAQAAHIPVHLGSMPLSVRAVLDEFAHPDIKATDRFILNDPFKGGTHLPDITVVAPCILPGDTAPRFYVANRAHHADIGGISAASMPLGSSIDDEGLRIPPMRLTDETMDWVCTNTRTPDERRGDLKAQLAALDVGIQRIGTLCGKYGTSTVEARGRELMAYTERVVRSVITAIPDGQYNALDLLDGDGFNATDIAIHCLITIRGDEAVLNFTASDDQVTGPVNAVRAITRSAVNYAFRCLVPADVPSNAGVMRPVRVITRPGSIVDALPPAAVAAGNVETSQRIVDVVFKALAKALPDQIPAASSGTMTNIAIGGPDNRHGGQFAYYETIGGASGGGPIHDGASGIHTHMTNTLNTPVEALEHAYPMLINTYAIRRSSGGAGKHRGGDGLMRSYSFAGPVEVTLLTERSSRRPYGLNGGGPGSAGEIRLVHSDGSDSILPGKCNIRLEPGQQLNVQSPGGGGWGKPNSGQ